MLLNSLCAIKKANDIGSGAVGWRRGCGKAGWDVVMQAEFQMLQKLCIYECIVQLPGQRGMGLGDVA